MYESSDSYFLRTTTGIQSEPDAFDEARLVLTFLANLGVTGILCIFRVVLKRKASKEAPGSSRLGFLKSFQQTNLLYQIQNATLKRH